VIIVEFCWKIPCVPNIDDAAAILDVFQKFGLDEIDTAVDLRRGIQTSLSALKTDNIDLVSGSFPVGRLDSG
jgi:hypothetical protein